MSISQIFFKKLGFPDKIFGIIFYYDSADNSLFASEAFVVIGNVFLALFTMRSLKTLLEKNCFFTKDLLLFYMFNF